MNFGLISSPDFTRLPGNNFLFKMDMSDQKRAWYDARDCGALSKSHPFQSAVCTLSVMDSKKSSDFMEDKLLEFCKTIPQNKKLSLKLSSSSGWSTASELGTTPSNVRKSELNYSIADGLALADDLYASNENLSKLMIQAHSEEIEQMKSSLAAALAAAEAAQAAQAAKPLPSRTSFDRKNQEPEPSAHPSAVNNQANSSSNNPPLSNRFRSAKDQFASEGGQLKDTPSLVQSSLKRAFSSTNNNNSNNTNKKPDQAPLPPELENYDRELVEKIMSDILDSGHPITFDDISGLEFAKKCVTELICWPMSRPDLFQGLRALPRGLLLFGPPGTGKTLIGKAIAHQSGATFFSISASSLMSKWIGEGEKTVRTLFAVAAYKQPAVVFIDEVDSLLCARSSEENEATRRIKTEFMVQLDGAGTSQTARVVIVGATNRPEELDEAVRRRFVKRIYIPLPDSESRRQLLTMLLSDCKHDVDGKAMEELVTRTEGFSGADIRSLCQEASMGPVREVAMQSQGNLSSINANTMPAISLLHFEGALDSVLPSVSSADLHRYVEWNNLYGSFRRMV